MMNLHFLNAPLLVKKSHFNKQTYADTVLGCSHSNTIEKKVYSKILLQLCTTKISIQKFEQIWFYSEQIESAFYMDACIVI